MANNKLEKLICKLPLISKIKKTNVPAASPNQNGAELRRSVDNSPWSHPYLTEGNIRRFREYSEAVWKFALDYHASDERPLKCAFIINMAQNMYKWASLARGHGVRSTLFLDPFDSTAINSPEWEEYDGEYEDIFDGEGFLRSNPHLRPKVETLKVQMDQVEFSDTVYRFVSGDRKPLMRLMAGAPGLRHEVFNAYSGFNPYFKWARELIKYDVLYAASTPFSAYLSGRPYCACSVGGDLEWDCGRPDDWGKLLTLSFNAARFLFISNPHVLGHSRRIGLTNGIYLPYTFDDGKYCPGEGVARKEWERKYGKKIFVLCTSRLDSKVKGYGPEFFNAISEVARKRKDLAFIFLLWGSNAAQFQEMTQRSGLGSSFIVLPPVGKLRLRDYYRSCDIVMDHFVYGYYGATALEAASTGKPVIMRMRTGHYAPLYKGDVAPIVNAASPAEVVKSLIELAGNKGLREAVGARTREWLVRNHGEKRTVPLMIALLRLAADRVPLPEGLRNPLCDDESAEEKEYHRSCIKE